MATRSRIGIQNGENVRHVYCHWDGYPSGNGVILQEHYNTKEKVEALIDLGDLSSLDKSVECPKGHSFDTRVDGFSVFYGRDRGEKDIEAITSHNRNDMLEEEYAYLWDGEWLINDITGKGEWENLQDVLNVEAGEAIG